MTATTTIALTMALSTVRLLRTLRVNAPTRQTLRERARMLLPFVLALGVVALGTVVYLELVQVLLVALD